MSDLSEMVELFNFPLNTIVVDDDRNYLDLVSQQLKNAKFTVYDSPAEAIKNINIIDVKIKYFLENNFSGVQDLNYNGIKKFIENHENRHGILVADYEMPHINGIELFAKFGNAALRKILLTNTYRIEEAVDALQKKLINYYLPKERVHILLDVIKEQQKLFFKGITKNIIDLLDINNFNFLSDKTYIDIFNNTCQQYNIEKYYIVNSYGNYYFENKTDKFIFLIYSNNDLLEIAQELPESQKYNVEQGNLIPSYFFDEPTKSNLIEAKKYGKYSYCIEKIVN